MPRSPGNRLLRVFASGVGVMLLPVVFAFVVKAFVVAAHPAAWLLGLVIGVAALVFIEALGLWMREVGRDEREWIATGYQLGPPARRAPPARAARSAGVVPSADAVALAGVAAPAEPAPAHRGFGARRATSLGTRGLLIVLLVGVVALLAVPVTIAGAVWHVLWLMIVGIVMLVFLVILNALLLPIIRMRAGHRSPLA
jgi:hypothetical protein